MKRLFLAAIFLVHGTAGAAEYICRTPDGKTMVQALPCPPAAKTTYSNTRPEESREEQAARRKLRDGRAQDFMEQRAAEKRQHQQAAAAAERQQQAQAEAQRQYDNQRRQELMMQELQRTRQEAIAARIAAEEAGAANAQRRPGPIFCNPNGIGGMVCN